MRRSQQQAGAGGSESRLVDARGRLVWQSPSRQLPACRSLFWLCIRSLLTLTHTSRRCTRYCIRLPAALVFNSMCAVRRASHTTYTRDLTLVRRTTCITHDIYARPHSFALYDVYYTQHHTYTYTHTRDLTLVRGRDLSAEVHSQTY
jgi:hypothetical protein